MSSTASRTRRAFALNIAKGGAASVTALDISKEAVEMTAHNAKQNGLAVEAVEADVFDFLTELDKKKDHSYDYIVLDPACLHQVKEERRSMKPSAATRRSTTV